MNMKIERPYFILTFRVGFTGGLKLTETTIPHLHSPFAIIEFVKKNVDATRFILDIKLPFVEKLKPQFHSLKGRPLRIPIETKPNYLNKLSNHEWHDMSDATFEAMYFDRKFPIFEFSKEGSKWASKGRTLSKKAKVFFADE